jgi:hypothetical protein
MVNGLDTSAFATAKRFADTVGSNGDGVAHAPCSATCCG